MAKTEQGLHLDQPATYRIRVQGRLDQSWSGCFGAMELAVEWDDDGAPVTALCGTVADQAALQGLLSELYSLGLPLISVQCIGKVEDRIDRRVKT